MNKLYYGDNLEILRNKIQDNSVDLCYIDPPFNSKRSYFQIYNNIGGEVDRAQSQAFTDTWTWDRSAETGFSQITSNYEGRFTRQVIELIRGLEIILGKGDLLAYLVSMTLRITEIFRVLKPTGSFYLHCDPTASHYLKLVLDAVFCGRGGDFQNEIVWCYKSRPQPKSYFGKKHDVLLFYTKSNSYTFNWEDVARPLSEATIRKYRLIDEEGRRYRLQGRGITGSPIRSAKDVSQEWEISHPELTVRDYLDEKIGVALEDWWVDINIINQNATERMGYPTQKPEDLLERIITASSNEGDLVLDAYCGCGTTIAVAERLNREWIGIDITYHSISLMLKRLVDSFGESVLEKVLEDGIPKDVEAARALANREDDYTRKEYEKWASLTYSNNRAVINEKKGADKGIDAIVYFKTKPDKTERMAIQVKSGHVNRGTIATLRGDMDRENAKMAALITLEEPSKPMIEEAAGSGFYHHELMGRDYPKVRIVTVREIIEDRVRLDLPLSYDSVRPGKKNSKNSDQLQIDF